VLGIITMLGYDGTVITSVGGTDVTKETGTIIGFVKVDGAMIVGGTVKWNVGTVTGEYSSKVGGNGVTTLLGTLGGK
jgi:hypothetical protein